MDINITDLTDDELVRYGAHFQNEAEQAKAKADAAKAEIRKRFAGRTLLKSPVGIEVKLVYARKFSEKLARELLTAEELDQITVPKLDGSLAKDLFGKAQYELMSTEQAARVSYKVL